MGMGKRDLCPYFLHVLFFKKEIFHSIAYTFDEIFISLSSGKKKLNHKFNHPTVSLFTYDIIIIFLSLISFLSNFCKNVEGWVLQQINVSDSCYFVWSNVLSYSCNCMKKEKIISTLEEAMTAFGFIFLMMQYLPFYENTEKFWKFPIIPQVVVISKWNTLYDFFHHCYLLILSW